MLKTYLKNSVILLSTALLSSGCVFLGDKSHEGQIRAMTKDNNVCFKADSYKPKGAVLSKPINADFKLVWIAVRENKGQTLWEMDIPIEQKKNGLSLNPDACIAYGKAQQPYNTIKQSNAPLSTGDYQVTMHVYNPNTLLGVTLKNSFEVENKNGRISVQ